MQPRFLHDLVSSQARQHSEATALWWQGNAISYDSLHHRVKQLAGRLSCTGEVGDRVAVLAWNCPGFVELIYGCSAAGRILVPLNARLAAPELIFQLQDAGVTTLFADADLLEGLSSHPDFPGDIQSIRLGEDYESWLTSEPGAALPTPDEDDPAWILYTSGSTGRPKGTILSHRAFMTGLHSAALGRPVLPGDRYLYPFPLFHVAAHNVLLQHRFGAAVVLVKSFESGETLRSCRELQVTTLSLAPTMIAMLLDHPDFKPEDLDSVRTIGYGASAMPQILLKRLLSLTHIGLCQSYGMTELAGSVSFLTVEDHQLAADSRPELLRSVGKPLPTARVKLARPNGEGCGKGEAGEILVMAEQCMTGYWRDPQASASALQQGWLHTGDIGRFDEEGYLYIVDRKKDMILSGGENIASREVEEVLRNHPAVRDCAVIGLPDPRWGETVCAVVVLHSTTPDQELDRYCREYIAGYKTPRHWIRQDALPVNAGGKIDKPRLRDMVLDYYISIQ